MNLALRLYSFEYGGRANGPGLRAVVWFQGCSLNCPGCFNPFTHDPCGGMDVDVDHLAADLLGDSNPIEGVSISGGEPFQQPEALQELLKLVRMANRSTLVFSGYTLAEIRLQPLGPAILQHIDVFIAGRYVRTMKTNHLLIGSSNQKLHLLTSRYRTADFAHIPKSEIILRVDGSVTLTGIEPRCMRGMGS